MNDLDLINNINSYILKQSNSFMSSTVLGHPTFIQVEVSNICNLRCIMCPIEEYQAAKKRKLTLDEFQRILSQFPFLKSIALFGLGEPLNNPRIFEMIKICKSKQIYTGVTTNATLLNEKRRSELINSGLDQLFISIDSIEPENYESVRIGAKFESVIENVKELIRQRNSLGKSQPSVGIVVVLMNRNGRELTKIMNFVYQLGVDFLLIKGLNTAYFEPSKLQYAGDEFDDAFSLSEALKSKGFDIQFSFPHKDKKQPRCHWPWMATFVTVNGDITPCCNCPDPMTLSFGNLFEQRFLEIWNNQRYRDFRTRLRKEIPSLCSSCPDHSFDYLREQPMISPVFDEHNEISCLEFTDANTSYKPGESITINLSDISRSVPSEPVDLWVSIRLPNGQRFFLVNNPSEFLFSSAPEPFKNALKRTVKTHPIFASMKISENAMKGKYIFYAIYQKEKAPLSHFQKNLRSNIAKQTITLI